MKKIRLILTVITLLGFGESLNAQTQATPEATPKVKSPEVPAAHLTKKEIFKRLDLTSEQRQLLRKNRGAYRKRIAELDGLLKVKKVELENEMERPEPDQAKLKEIADGIGDLQGQKISEKIKAELEVEKKILTPQQVDQLKAMQGKESYSEEMLP